MSEKVRGKIIEITNDGSITTQLSDGEYRLFEPSNKNLFHGMKEGDEFFMEFKNDNGGLLITSSKVNDDVHFRNELERIVVEFLEEKWNCNFIHTEKDVDKSASYSPIDGFMVRDKKLVAMIENRSRKEKLDDVKGWGGILINYDKLKKAIDLSQTLKVPFFFVAYFFNDGLVVGWEIVDKDGLISCEMTLKKKLAQDNLKKGTDVKKERNVAILTNSKMFKIGELNYKEKLKK